MILDLLSSVTQWSQRSTDAQMVGGIVRCGSTTEWIRRKSLNTENKSTLDGLKPARSELVICKVGTKLGMGQKTQPKGCSVKRLHTESQAQRCAKINMCLKPKSRSSPSEVHVSQRSPPKVVREHEGGVRWHDPERSPRIWVLLVLGTGQDPGPWDTDSVIIFKTTGSKVELAVTPRGWVCAPTWNCHLVSVVINVLSKPANSQCEPHVSTASSPPWDKDTGTLFSAFGHWLSSALGSVQRDFISLPKRTVATLSSVSPSLRLWRYKTYIQSFNWSRIQTGSRPWRAWHVGSPHFISHLCKCKAYWTYGVTVTGDAGCCHPCDPRNADTI